VAGLRVGRVGEIGFNMDAPNEERIEVRLLLDVPVTLRTDYLISIEETTMLGGRHISVEPGRFEGDALQLAEGQNLRGTVAENPLAALGAVGDLVDRNAEAFGNILKSLEETVAKINAGEGTAGRLINNVQLGRDLSEAVASIRTVAENLAVTTADINAGRGVIGALVNDDLLVSDLKAIVADIRSIAGDLSEGRGTLGRFLKDDSMADDFQAAVQSISTFAKSLVEGEGLVARLINDPALSDQAAELVTNLRQTSVDLAAIIAHARAGEGTVGKLIMDEELYEEILTTVGLLTRSLEDYREAAPITALTGVLFSVF
ncbi:MAG: hypothetical protein ACI9K5_003039, partial [Gammaproteobacteria bacterium]